MSGSNRYSHYTVDKFDFPAIVCKYIVTGSV